MSSVFHKLGPFLGVLFPGDFHNTHFDRVDVRDVIMMWIKLLRGERFVEMADCISAVLEMEERRRDGGVARIRQAASTNHEGWVYMSDFNCIVSVLQRDGVAYVCCTHGGGGMASSSAILHNATIHTDVVFTGRLNSKELGESLKMLSYPHNQDSLRSVLAMMVGGYAHPVEKFMCSPTTNQATTSPFMCATNFVSAILGLKMNAELPIARLRAAAFDEMMGAVTSFGSRNPKGTTILTNLFKLCATQVDPTRAENTMLELRDSLAEPMLTTSLHTSYTDKTPIHCLRRSWRLGAQHLSDCLEELQSHLRVHREARSTEAMFPLDKLSENQTAFSTNPETFCLPETPHIIYSIVDGEVRETKLPIRISMEIVRNSRSRNFRNHLKSLRVSCDVDTPLAREALGGVMRGLNMEHIDGREVRGRPHMEDAAVTVLLDVMKDGGVTVTNQDGNVESVGRFGALVTAICGSSVSLDLTRRDMDDVARTILEKKQAQYTAMLVEHVDNYPRSRWPILDIADVYPRFDVGDMPTPTNATPPATRDLCHMDDPLNHMRGIGSLREAYTPTTGLPLPGTELSRVMNETDIFTCQFTSATRSCTLSDLIAHILRMDLQGAMSGQYGLTMLIRDLASYVCRIDHILSQQLGLLMLIEEVHAALRTHHADAGISSKDTPDSTKSKHTNSLCSLVYLAMVVRFILITKASDDDVRSQSTVTRLEELVNEMVADIVDDTHVLTYCGGKKHNDVLLALDALPSPFGKRSVETVRRLGARVTRLAVVAYCFQPSHRIRSALRHIVNDAALGPHFLEGVADALVGMHGVEREGILFGLYNDAEGREAHMMARFGDMVFRLAIGPGTCMDNPNAHSSANGTSIMRGREFKVSYDGDGQLVYTDASFQSGSPIITRDFVTYSTKLTQTDTNMRELESAELSVSLGTWAMADDVVTALVSPRCRMSMNGIRFTLRSARNEDVVFMTETPAFPTSSAGDPCFSPNLDEGVIAVDMSYSIPCKFVSSTNEYVIERDILTKLLGLPKCAKVEALHGSASRFRLTVHLTHTPPEVKSPVTLTYTHGGEEAAHLLLSHSSEEWEVCPLGNYAARACGVTGTKDKAAWLPACIECAARVSRQRDIIVWRRVADGAVFAVICSSANVMFKTFGTQTTMLLGGKEYDVIPHPPSDGPQSTLTDPNGIYPGVWVQSRLSSQVSLAFGDVDMRESSNAWYSPGLVSADDLMQTKEFYTPLGSAVLAFESSTRDVHLVPLDALGGFQPALSTKAAMCLYRQALLMNNIDLMQEIRHTQFTSAMDTLPTRGCGDALDLLREEHDPEATVTLDTERMRNAMWANVARKLQNAQTGGPARWQHWWATLTSEHTAVLVSPTSTHLANHKDARGTFQKLAHKLGVTPELPPDVYLHEESIRLLNYLIALHATVRPGDGLSSVRFYVSPPPTALPMEPPPVPSRLQAVYRRSREAIERVAMDGPQDGTPDVWRRIVADVGLILSGFSSRRHAPDVIRLAFAEVDGEEMLVRGGLMVDLNVMCTSLAMGFEHSVTKLLLRGAPEEGRSKEVVLVEMTRGYYLRADQLAVIRTLLDDVRTGKLSVTQMLMGGGKTSAISPVVFLSVLRGEQAPLVVVPEHLVETARFLIATPMQRWTVHRMASRMGEYPNVVSDTQVKEWWVMQDDPSRDERVVAIVDEHDMVTDPTTSELNIPVTFNTHDDLVEKARLFRTILSWLNDVYSAPEEVRAAIDKTLQENAAVRSPNFNVIDFDAFNKVMGPHLRRVLGPIMAKKFMSLLSLRSGVHFGLGERSELEMVPYKAKGEPDDESSFSDTDVRLYVNIAARSGAGLSINDVKELLCTISRSGRNPSVRGMGKHLWGVMGFTEEDWSWLAAFHTRPTTEQQRHAVAAHAKLVKERKHSSRTLLDFFSEFVLVPRLRRYASEKQVANGILFLTQAFAGKVVGFTGTPDLVPLYTGEVPRFGAYMREVHSDDAANEMMKMALHTATQHTNHSTTDTDLIFDVCRCVKEGNEDQKRTRAFIDAAASIFAMSNHEVADEMRRLLVGHSSIQYVGYVDPASGLSVVDMRGAVHPLTSDIDPETVFMYFDQGNTTGVDIKLASNAHSILTTSTSTSMRDLYQAAFRMRQLGRGQTVELWTSISSVGVLGVGGDVLPGISARDAQRQRDITSSMVRQLLELFLGRVAIEVGEDVDEVTPLLARFSENAPDVAQQLRDLIEGRGGVGKRLLGTVRQQEQEQGQEREQEQEEEQERERERQRRRESVTRHSFNTTRDYAAISMLPLYVTDGALGKRVVRTQITYDALSGEVIHEDVSVDEATGLQDDEHVVAFSEAMLLPEHPPRVQVPTGFRDDDFLRFAVYIPEVHPPSLRLVTNLFGSHTSPPSHQSKHVLFEISRMTPMHVGSSVTLDDLASLFTNEHFMCSVERARHLSGVCLVNTNHVDTYSLPHPPIVNTRHMSPEDTDALINNTPLYKASVRRMKDDDFADVDERIKTSTTWQLLPFTQQLAQAASIMGVSMRTVLDWNRELARHRTTLRSLAGVTSVTELVRRAATPMCAGEATDFHAALMFVHSMMKDADALAVLPKVQVLDEAEPNRWAEAEISDEMSRATQELRVVYGEESGQESVDPFCWLTNTSDDAC